MEDKNRKKVTDAVVSVSEVAASIALGPGASTAVKLLKHTLTSVLDHVVERRERRAMQFVEEFMGSGYPSESAIHLVEAEMARAPAETKDAVFDAVRAIDEVLSDNVVPALALLARDYRRAGRPKDRFFVGVLRLLRDLDAREYEALRNLATVIAKTWPDPEAQSIYIAKIIEPGRVVLWVAPNRTMEWDARHDGLLHNLEVVGFADVLTGVRVSGHPGEQQVWRIEREPWNRLNEILGRR